jgi:hypothetical protein
MYPGILVQMITTKQPTADMIEVAIVSMEQALEADGETLPSGSGTVPRDLLELRGATSGSGAATGAAAGGASGVTAGGSPATIDPPLPGA